jgi:hypothetical protein
LLRFDFWSNKEGEMNKNESILIQQMTNVLPPIIISQFSGLKLSPAEAKDFIQFLLDEGILPGSFKEFN